MASAFLKLEGNTVRNRIWSFLIVHSDFDYSMRDIAKFSKVSYTALKGIWKEFIKRKIVVHTRIVGKAKMFRLNMKNPQVEKFIDYYWSVVELEVDRQLGLDKKEIPQDNFSSSSAGAIAASAKGI